MEYGKESDNPGASPKCFVCRDLGTTHLGGSQLVHMKDLSRSAFNCSPCALILDGVSKTVERVGEIIKLWISTNGTAGALIHYLLEDSDNPAVELFTCRGKNRSSLH
jgi:hypothetical protein